MTHSDCATYGGLVAFNGDVVLRSKSNYFRIVDHSPRNVRVGRLFPVITDGANAVHCSETIRHLAKEMPKEF
jgi:hypothetical protein